MVIREVISGHQSSSELISGHQWASVVIRAHQSLSDVIRANQWSSKVIRGDQNYSELISGHQKSCTLAPMGASTCPVPPLMLAVRPSHCGGGCCSRCSDPSVLRPSTSTRSTRLKALRGGAPTVHTLEEWPLVPYVVPDEGGHQRGNQWSSER